MIQITDSNYEKIIKGYLGKGRVVIAMAGNPECMNCQKTKINIDTYQTKYDTSKIVFMYMHNSFDFALEKDYQMNELNEYPKSVIFTDWEERAYTEGVITIDEMIEIESLTKV